MTRRLADEITALATSHPVPAEDKLARRLSRLERITKFYEEKAGAAPEKQAFMFAGFVSALLYAASIMKMYRALTKQIARLAKEAESDKL